ncbi:hypothetical protein C0V78_11705 [Novosphingobium sp. TH158]|nr:hypothetical protein C0V78_11705 [Novosphingobium sp. TH158]
MPLRASERVSAACRRALLSSVIGRVRSAARTDAAVSSPIEPEAPRFGRSMPPRIPPPTPMPMPPAPMPPPAPTPPPAPMPPLGTPPGLAWAGIASAIEAATRLEIERKERIESLLGLCRSFPPTSSQ